jgi:hypothetical protein
MAKISPKMKIFLINFILGKHFFSEKNSQIFWAEKMTNSLWQKIDDG